MADSGGQKASGAADADEYLLSYFSSTDIVVISGSRAGSLLLTYEIVGLSNVVVPHCHLQGLFGEVCIFYVVTELLQKIAESKSSSLQNDHIQLHNTLFQITTKYKVKDLGLNMLNKTI